MMAEPSTQEQARVRSFVERYVIARAPHFTVGKETEEAWACVLEGKSLYKRIEDMARSIDREVNLGDGDQGLPLP
jgi:hypothetical protein